MKKFISLLLAALMLLTLVPACADDVFEGMLTYKEGQHLVGTDMKAGEYVLLATSKYGGYFAISTDALGRNIICNDLFDVNSILTVKAGEYVELERCMAVLATDFYRVYSIRTDSCGTMLKVGYDIMPGTYRLRAETGKQGYYCIYNDSRHTKIIDNGLFSNSSYITLRTGQYVILSRCCIAN